MLEVKNLTKVYKSHQKQTVTALNNINFTLEDKGFVFIVGKSGSGKSTLLNMLGGLDNITEGDIICDGNSLAGFSPKEFDNYRNSYLGFIFQDYCLIEDLNVKQNIASALDLLGGEIDKADKDSLVDMALNNVDLNIELKNRFVKELSGGQKQRIAIARAVIKNPKMILADEPTGNLDSKTSKKILDLLQKMSRDRLVIIVSHNLDDAREYADRIIELADGNIISDTSRNNDLKNELTFVDGILTLPKDKSLTEEEVEEINGQLKNNNVKSIKQNKGCFENTKPVESTGKKTEIKSGKLYFGNAFKLAINFMKNRKFMAGTTIFITSLLVFVFGICQFFMQFDVTNSLKDAIVYNNEKDIIAYKTYYSDETLKTLADENNVEIADEEIEDFISNGYTGEIFELISYNMPVTSYHFDSGRSLVNRNIFTYIYVQETYGTLICNEEYLKEKFAIDGELKILAGQGLGTKEYGVIMTDYVADSLLTIRPEFKNKTYDYLVEKLLQDRIYVNAIIDTDYETKHSELIKIVSQQTAGFRDVEYDKDDLKKKYMEFKNDVVKYYGVLYTINQNFLEDLSLYTTRYHLPFGIAKLILNDYDREKSCGALYFVKDTSLSGNEMAMEMEIFNSMLGSVCGNYETIEDFTSPLSITVERLSGDKNKEEALVSMDLNLTKLYPNNKSSFKSGQNMIFVSEELFYNTIYPNAFSTIALYFTDENQIESIYNTINDEPYLFQSKVYSSVNLIGSIVKIFEDFFALLVITISVICIIMLISFAYGNIKKRYYEIGVLKALGASTKDIGLVFGLQTILSGLIICAVSSFALMFLCSPINNIISNALVEFAQNDALSKIVVIAFNPLTMLINVILIMIVTIISYCVPLIKLHRIKPSLIIRNK